PAVRKRLVLNPTSNWRKIIWHKPAKWARPPGNSEREPASRRVWARRWVSLQLTGSATRQSRWSSVFSRFECASLLFRSQQREQDHVADGFCAGKQHGEPIHADSNAAGRRHAMFKGE